jgi:serine/threonine protein kinase
VDPNAYVKKQLLGGVGNAETYTGTEIASGRDVTLKYVFVGQDADRVLFHREVEVLFQMIHPATQSLIGWALLESGPEKTGLIVMEFMEFGSLDNVNRQSRKGQVPVWWDATARSKAVIGIIAGMTYFHALGLLHRNLSPEAIFIDSEHEVRIADFRRAKKAELTQTMATETSLTQAPETFQEGGYTNKVDVYSFAVTLYLMWADTDKLDDRVDAKRPGILIWEERIGKGARFAKHPVIPAFYWRIITSCWAQAPERRPSFAELLQTFSTDRGWVLPGTDENALSAYETKVGRGLVLPSA